MAIRGFLNELSKYKVRYKSKNHNDKILQAPEPIEEKASQQKNMFAIF